MAEAKTIRRLQKVLDFYNKQLDLLKLQLASQISVVKKHQQEIIQLNDSITNSHHQLSHSPINLAQLQMGYQFQSYTALRITERENKLAEANEDLNRKRAALRSQISKIESMEKLIERKASAIAYERVKREQILADERYLNSKH